MPATFVVPELIEECLSAKQGETLIYEIPFYLRSLKLHSAFPSNGVSALAKFKTTQAHCLEVGDKVSLSDTNCSGCEDTKDCYTVASIVSAYCFEIEEPFFDGEDTRCPVCTSGKVNVPMDLTGIEFFGQVRPNHSAAEYQPPITGSVKSGSNVVTVSSCDGCFGPKICQYVDMPDAGISRGIIQRISKRALGSKCDQRFSCQLELDQNAMTTVSNASLLLNTDVLAEFTTDDSCADCGVISLILKTNTIPVPWCCESKIPGSKTQTAYGPHKWDVIARTADGDFFIRCGDLYMLPSVTVAP